MMVVGNKPSINKRHKNMSHTLRKGRGNVVIVKVSNASWIGAQNVDERR